MRRLLLIVVIVLVMCGTVFAGAGRETAGASSTAMSSKYHESPILAPLVNSGEILPVDERVPAAPRVVTPYESVGQFGGTLNARLAVSPGGWTYYQSVAYERLVRLQPFFGPNHTYEFEPMVAEAYEVSADAKTYTFHLREGMRWSDGEPFTTEDIRFYWEDVMQNPDLGPLLGVKILDAEIVVVDAQTFRIIFPQPRRIFLFEQAWDYKPAVRWLDFPAHYMKLFHADYATQSELTSMADAAVLSSWNLLLRDKTEVALNPDLPVIYPWKLAEKLDASGVGTFRRNPYYYSVDTAGNQLPYIDEVRALPWQGETAIAKQIQGDIDYHWLWWSAADYPILKQNERVGHYRMGPEVNSRGTTFGIFINQTTEDPVLRNIFQDLQFRQAVSYAIDRDEVVDVVLNGQAVAGGLSVGDSVSFYRPEWPEMYAQYDLARANSLLDEMGLRWDAAHEFRLRPDGKKLDVIFIYTTLRQMWVPGYQLFAEYMKAIGVNLILQSLENSVWEQTAALNSAQWTSEELPLHDGLTLFLAPFVRFNWGAEWGRWYTTKGAEGVEPPASIKRVFELKDLADSSSSFEDRSRYMGEATDILVREARITGNVGYEYRGSSISNRVKNYSFDMENMVNLDIMAYPAAFREPAQLWIAK